MIHPLDDSKYQILHNKPEILCHPHVPAPLHGVAPRTIMGEDWWDITRQKVYESNNYYCVACGVHKSMAKQYKWLEAHEFWNIDYQKGVCTIASIEPLCHYCHNFIHTQRLSMIMGKSKTKDEVRDILEHGFNVLSKNNLKCNPFTLKLAIDLRCDIKDVVSYRMPKENTSLNWGDWTLIWENKEYHSQFKDESEWADFYEAKNNDPSN